MKRAVPMTVLLALSLPLAACGASSTTNKTGIAGKAPKLQSHPLGKRTKTSGCHTHGGLPDAACTPGAIYPNATKNQICVLGYSRRVRRVRSSTKRLVFAEYGISSHSAGQYEVDHLVSLEVGGSNAIANLWPEPANPRPGFHEKDRVENYLHAQICRGKLNLGQAQRQEASNWPTYLGQAR